MQPLWNWLARTGTPQTEPVRADQVRNTAGGYVFAIDAWQQLERFLILGTEGGTYYVSETVLTAENATAAVECLRLDGERVVKMVAGISAAGRAPSNDAALFVLALAASARYAAPATNAAAFAALPLVARTAPHLMQFAGYVQELRGWGRGLRRAVADWYTARPAGELAYQLLKYPARQGFAHRDLIRLAHPRAASPQQSELLRWAVDGVLPAVEQAGQIHAVARLKTAANAEQAAAIIRDARLTHEMVPGEWKAHAAVWHALAEQMPLTALVRSLGKLTAVGVLAAQGEFTRVVGERLTNAAALRRSRLHPVAVLSALMAYRGGAGVRGSLEWRPVGDVIDALDAAFYLAFEHVEPVNQRVYLAMDASGSMQGAACHGMPHVTAAMAAAALAMVLARREPRHILAAFHEQVWQPDITQKDRLDRAVSAIARAPKGTDASLPFQDALAHGWEVDCFVIVTDSETWAGAQHPVQALAEYRRVTGIPAKLAVLATEASRYSICDPADAHQLDVAGFDASVPEVLADFMKGGGSGCLP